MCIFIPENSNNLLQLSSLECMQVLLLSSLLYSLRVSAVLDHFGYPAPHLDQWQQHIWYDLGATQEVLHQMRIRLL